MSNIEQKNSTKQESNFANTPTSKKIGFFSAMLVVVGSSVGAGIFFKSGTVLSDSQNSIVLAIFCWLFAAFAVIAMGLALIEIASARNDNLSVIGWCQTFNGRFTYKMCKNFMFYLYLPLTYFFMPLYVVMSFQDGIGSLYDNYNGLGTDADWAILMVFAILIAVYFIVANGLSSRLGNIHNWIITSVKFFPLVFAAILGFVIVGMNNGEIASDGLAAGFPVPDDTDSVNESAAYVNESADSIFSFQNLSPGFGIFIAMGAIFFAYDGFYVTAGIQTELKEPKKAPWAILTGLIVVTVIYLIIAISMSVGSTDGTAYGYQDFLEEHGALWLYSLFQILIGIGVLGIINGFSLWSTRYVEDLVKGNEIPFSARYVSKLNDKNAKVGIMYNLVISIPVIIIFCLIGGLGYVDSTGYTDWYGTGVGQLYSFADLMANWCSVLAFAFILLAILGAYRNRKTNAIKVQKNKYFKPMAICAMITMGLPIVLTFFAPVADLFMLFWIPTNGGDSYNYTNDVLVPRIMLVIVLFIFIGLMILPTIIDDYKAKKMHGSIEKGDIAKLEKIANATNKTLKETLIETIAAQKRVNLNVEEQKILGVKTFDEINLLTNQ